MASSDTTIPIQSLPREAEVGDMFHVILGTGEYFQYVIIFGQIFFKIFNLFIFVEIEIS